MATPQQPACRSRDRTKSLLRPARGQIDSLPPGSCPAELSCGQGEAPADDPIGNIITLLPGRIRLGREMTCHAQPLRIGLIAAKLADLATPPNGPTSKSAARR